MRNEDFEILQRRQPAKTNPGVDQSAVAGVTPLQLFAVSILQRKPDGDPPHLSGWKRALLNL